MRASALTGMRGIPGGRPKILTGVPDVGKPFLPYGPIIADFAHRGVQA